MNEERVVFSVTILQIIVHTITYVFSSSTCGLYMQFYRPLDKDHFHKGMEYTHLDIMITRKRDTQLLIIIRITFIKQAITNSVAFKRKTRAVNSHITISNTGSGG